MRSLPMPSAFAIRSESAAERRAVSSGFMVPMFFTATKHAGAAVPPNVSAAGTKQVMTQRSGLPKCSAARRDRSERSAPRSAGFASAGAKSWMSGMLLLLGFATDEVERGGLVLLIIGGDDQQTGALIAFLLLKRAERRLDDVGAAA